MLGRFVVRFCMVSIPQRKVNGHYEPVGRLWPSGRFGIGWRLNGDREETHHETLFWKGRRLQVDKGHGGQYSTANMEAAQVGSSNARNYHTLPEPNDCPHYSVPRGSKGMTKYGRNVVESACKLLEWKYGKKNLSFVTLTLPNITDDECWAIAANWNNIVRVFFQRLRRAARRKGREFHYVGVTEYQPKRTRREAIPALHLHFVMHGRVGGSYIFSPKQFRYHWRNALRSYVSGSKFWDACENVQQVKASAGSYLGKYLSKGVSEDSDIRRTRPLAPLPSAWYSISRVLLRSVKGAVIDSPDILGWLAEVGKSQESSGFFMSWFEVMLDFGDGWGLKGFAGSLAPKILKSIYQSTGHYAWLGRSLDMAC